MRIDDPRQIHPILSFMDEDTFFAVITLFLIFLISGVVCIYFLSKFTETILWHAEILLSAIVIIAGAVSMSSFIIALREVRNIASNIRR